MPRIQQFLMSLILTISLMSSFTKALSQNGRYRIDTVQTFRESHYVWHFHSSNDTLYYTLDIEGDTTGSFELHASYDRGNTWNHIITMPGDIYFSKSDATIAVFQPHDTNNTRLTLLKGNGIVHDTIFDQSSFLSTYYPRTLIFHPNDANVIFLRIDLEGRRYRTYTLFVSTDHGKSWQHLDVPEPKKGLGNMTTYVHDYKYPTNWRFYVQSDDSEGSVEFYVTNDSGRTFTETGRVLEPLFNFFEENTHVRSTIKSNLTQYPLVVTPNDSVVRELEWIGHLRAQLPYDSSLYSMINPTKFGGPEEPVTRVAYDEINKSTFAYAISLYDRITGTSQYSPEGIAITLDTGINWEWIMAPIDRRKVRTLSYDRATKHLYALVYDWNSSFDRRTFRILSMYDPTITGVQENPICGNTSYPNPNNGVFVVVLGQNFTNEVEFSLYDSNGQLTAIEPMQSTSVIDGSIHSFSVRGISSGIYQLVCRSGNSISATTLTILH